ncbi:MAG: Uma2 family endonuclease [Anaerolineae bacterium]|nr:Uma2 family endonuclease [Anaerolineae bacterium]
MHPTAQRLFTVDEFHRMGETGIFSADDRVELIEGEIIHMPPIGSYHAAHVDRLNMLLYPHVAQIAIIRVQSPIELTDHSEPQPDLALLKPRKDFYAGSHPLSSDVLLVIEVADTTVHDDRTVKTLLYAAAGIPEMWLIDLPAAVIDVCSNPVDEQYQTIQHLKRGDALTSPTIHELVLKVEDILG